MSSIVRTGGSNIDRSADLRGLSTDTKPTKAQGDNVPHGSTWYNMDDCTKYMYNEDNDTWYNIPNGGGGTGDMQKSVYDPTNTVANAGGIDTYVGDEINNAKSEIITEVEGNIATTANNLIDDTVGWTNKNLLPITLDQLKAINTSGTWEDNVYTYRNITITVDIFNNLITGINVNGTNTTGSVVFKLTDNFVYQLLSEDKYYISDGVDTTAIVSGSAYISVERKKGESGESHYLSTNNEERSTKFTVDYSIYDYYFVNIYIPNNSSINNAVFYPMIRRASISDDTYEPYTKTVKDEIFNLNSSVGNLKTRVGLAEGNIQTLNEIKANKSDLGTASTKNSTSVVTDSSDLVESGAVKDIVGWGNKNKLQVRKELTSTSLFTVNRNNYDEVTSIVGNGRVTADQTLWLIGNGWNYSNCEDVSKYFKAGQTYTLSDGTNNDSNQFIQLNIRDSEGVILSARSDNLNEYHRIFTMPSDLTGLKIHCWLRVNNGQSMTNKVFYPQLEEGASITSFEPYHASAEESLEQKCDNSVIGTVEDGTTASQAYAVGEHFIRDGAFCTVTQAISSGGTLTEGTNYTSGDVADELDVVDITNQCLFNSDSSFNSGWTHIFKQGRHIFGTLRFTTPSTVTSDKAVVTLPNDCLSNNSYIVGSIKKVWDATPCGILGMNENNQVIRLMSTGWEASMEVVAEFSAFIK